MAVRRRNKMKTTTVKQAMMLCVGNKNWFMPKHILIETNSKHEKILADIAYEAFDKYKKEQDEDIYLVSYSYYGDVEVMGDFA
jgi:hypothetical protein